MRSIILLAALALPFAAAAQTTSPPISNPSAGPATTPAPVPSVAPGTPKTGAPSIPPERIAPSAGGAAGSSDSSMPSSSPLSGAPPSVNSGTGQMAPHGDSPTRLPPNQSR
jgi:hypothetical protein